jgi:hypothetical protein
MLRGGSIAEKWRQIFGDKVAFEDKCWLTGGEVVAH